MRYAVALLLLVPLALAVPAALAQDPDASEPYRKAAIGEPVPPIRVIDGQTNKEEKDFFGKFRKQILILMFIRTTDPSSEDALNTLGKILSEFGSKGVTSVVVSDEKLQKINDYVRSKNYSGETLGNAFLEIPFDVSAVPRVYLIDPDGILVNRFHPSDRFEERIREQLQRTPPQGVDGTALLKRLGELRPLVADKKIGRAYTILAEVEKFAKGKKEVEDEAKKIRERVEEAAKQWLTDARTASSEKRHDEAMRILAELSVRFAGQKIAQEADTEISRIMGERDLKPKMRTAIENARAEMLLDQAAEHEAAERYIEAVRLCREVMVKFEGTDAATRAEEAIDRINNDPRAQTEILARRGEEQAERWLEIADRFQKQGMYGKAREYYEQIREQFPRSPSAVAAIDRLKNLPKEEVEEDLERDSVETPESEDKG